MHTIASAKAPNATLALSILYLRCTQERTWDTVNVLLTFNSLFEMPALVDACIAALCALAFNSLFEMRSHTRRPTGACDTCPFNSLFEMRSATRHASAAPRCFSFNSLFEMRRRCECGRLFSGIAFLSILYLRCAEGAGQKGRRGGAFQFSI